MGNGSVPALKSLIPWGRFCEIHTHNPLLPSHVHSYAKSGHAASLIISLFNSANEGQRCVFCLSPSFRKGIKGPGVPRNLKEHPNPNFRALQSSITYSIQHFLSHLQRPLPHHAQPPSILRSCRPLHRRSVGLRTSKKRHQPRNTRRIRLSFL